MLVLSKILNVFYLECTLYFLTLELFKYYSMPKYVALFRGINVSGKNLIRMESLRDFFGSLGLKDVQSYIQSGNIIFYTDEKNSQLLENLLEKEFLQHFGYSVPILVLTKERVKTALDSSPIAVSKEESKISSYYVFLKDTPLLEKQDSFREETFEYERFTIYDKLVYLECLKGMGKAKLNTNIIEKKLGVPATARNQRTMLKIYSLLEN